MNTKPLVSGIIIFLNGEKFIEEAIASVFAQTYENWELLLVDDGSTDNSTEIAKQYAQKYPEKVCYLEHENHQNRGMSATRNLGISNAKGEYIAFLDADDIWLPQKLEKQLETFHLQPEAAVVCGPTQWWFSWTGKPQDTVLDSMREVAPQSDTLYAPPTLLTLLLQNEARTPATCGVLIRRMLFETTGGFEESFRGMYEDQAFFAKVYLKAKVFVTRECWDRYRQHRNNWTIPSFPTKSSTDAIFKLASRLFIRTRSSGKKTLECSPECTLALSSSGVILPAKSSKINHAGSAVDIAFLCSPLVMDSIQNERQSYN
jgi:glycosyltransferase involved in cell wall biosynthesis